MTYFWKETAGWFYGEPNGSKDGPFASYEKMLNLMNYERKRKPAARTSDPDSMSRSKIVALYNELAAKTGDKPVGDFRDKASAQRRLAAIQAKVNQE